MAGVANSLCIVGVLALLVIVTVLTAYIAHRIHKMFRQNLGTMFSSGAQLDEKSGEHVLMPTSARRVATTLVILLALPLGNLAFQITVHENYLDVNDPILIIIIILLAIYAASVPLVVWRMKLRNAFRFDEKGIRECRDSAIIKSVEWWNVDVVSARIFRPIIIEWVGDRMTVPTSHTGVLDLLRMISAKVPENRQIGIGKMIERLEMAQGMTGNLGLTQ